MPGRKAMQTAKQQGYDNRAAFLKAYAATRDLDQALDEIGLNRSWLYKNTGRWADFRAAYQALKRRTPAPGENELTAHSVEWDHTFAGFRHTFLGRHSPWFHVALCDEIDAIEGGDIMLVIWPPEHGKTSLFEDRCTMDVAIDPTIRITVGKSKIDFAELVVSTVRQRLSPEVFEYWKLRERFGPFAPTLGQNAFQQQQTWQKGAFNVFKRRLGDERDFNMQALGMGSDVAGTRCDRLMVDDPQSRKTLALTDKILETLRDDWFSRPGVTGSTAILMNVVGDDDIAERLIDDEVCDHVTVLKAHDPDRYLDLGPRANKDGVMEPSEFLWPERYSEQDYDRLRRNAGPEGWARKYQQDWRPSIGRTFSQEMIDNCQNPLRRLHHPPPRHPADKPADVWCSIDPAFKRTAVTSACFEPTILRVLDSYAESSLRTTGQMLDMLAAQITHWHRPGISHVTHVVVETKGMQKGLITDDALLELQAEIGFEIVSQETGWDKRDEDFGTAQMARSMTRAELDFPAADDESRERFITLYREMKDWRPNVHGNKQKMDEVMSLWFLWTRWHKQRRQSIKRGSDASQFGFGGIPTMPGFVTAPRTAADLSGWKFGQLSR
jgi:hypothetical protein